METPWGGNRKKTSDLTAAGNPPKTVRSSIAPAGQTQRFCTASHGQSFLTKMATILACLCVSPANLPSAATAASGVEGSMTVDRLDASSFPHGDAATHQFDQHGRFDTDHPKYNTGAVDMRQCSIVKVSERSNCWLKPGPPEVFSCWISGCCWNVYHNDTASGPLCFFPANYDGYSADFVTTTKSGIVANLTRTTQSIFHPDIDRLTMRIDFQTESRLRIKIYDPNDARFEPPVAVPEGAAAVEKPLYKVKVDKKPFNIVVTRRSTGATLFDTTGMAPLIFTDQFLQMGTRLASPYLYGLGEHRHQFLQEVNTWRKIVFWSNGHPPREGVNGYGVHPFFLNLEDAQMAEEEKDRGVRNAHGVLFLNSNAAEAALQPHGEKSGAVTFRTTGGVLDFFILLGPTPVSVAAQYTKVVGQPHMPPFWALGFHLCRWGYNSTEKLSTVIQRNRKARIPYDVQWTDIDYMDAHKDWTYDTHNYTQLPEVVKDLHKNQQRYIIMADPAISSSQKPGYLPFDDGIKMDIFIKNASGNILIGKVWPGFTAFPDFFHPRAVEYWHKQAKSFHDKVPFDGLWIDMNEPDNFVDGSIHGCRTKSKYDNPPYIPSTLDGGKLQHSTLCGSARHNLSVHYNLHSMYGWSHGKVSRAALDALYGGNKRSPIISRSTFVGSGAFAGHWLGDNESKFKDMAYSIPGVLNFNLFGIPFVGADICGFHGPTTPELCTRWHQLGAFYPFMRNHNTLTPHDQDPASFKSPYVDYIRQALQLRYSLLAVLYTAFYKAHTQGLPIVRPLFYHFPGTETIDDQFLWGDNLLVSPVLTSQSTSVKAHLPEGTWYDFHTGKPLKGQGKTVTLSAPIDKINVHVRGGSVLPLLPPTERTDQSRKEKFTIVVAPDTKGSASGELFWDDGESYDSIPSKKYSLIEFSLKGSTLTSFASVSGYKPDEGIQAGTVEILAVTSFPSAVKVNGVSTSFRYEGLRDRLTVFNLSVDLLKPMKITWT